MKRKCKNCKAEYVLPATVRTGVCPECGTTSLQSDAVGDGDEGMPASALAALPELDDRGQLPASIQVFPPGKGVRFTLQDYPGQEFEMDVDAAVAAKADEDLQAMVGRAGRQQGSSPYADKNHEDAEAVFHPVRFFWGGEDPKDGGVRVIPEWTPFGAQLVRAKAFKYFSGNFLFSKARKKFLGLINENVGGLVNRPGFATQQAFAKAAPSTTTNENTNMDAKEFKQIVDDALKPISDRITKLEATPAQAAADKTTLATQISAAVETALKPAVEAALKPIKESQEAALKARAKSTVAKYVGRPGLAPQDTDAIAFWEAQVIANEEAAVKQLDKLPARASARQYTTSTPGTTTATLEATEPEDVFMAKAKAFGEKNKITDEVEMLQAFGRTPEGRELHAQYREKVNTRTTGK